jgi:RNA polymerase sigma-70 factor (ECF subfamily)
LSRASRFTRIYEEHQPAVLAYFLRRANAPDAHDGTADVFGVAWRRIDDIPRGDDELPWLFGVARNVLSHQRRSAGRFRRLAGHIGSQPVWVSPDPATEIVQNLESARVLDAAATLKASDQEILRLAAWEGLRHAEIAGILEISVAAVDQRLHRAKSRLADAYTAAWGEASSTAYEGGVA